MNKADFVKEAENKYGQQFDYSYLPAVLKPRQLEIVICKTHGQFKVSPRDHLRSKYGCPRCRCDKVKIPNSKLITQFVQKSCNKFNNKFSYQNTDYSKRPNDVNVVTCPIHGNIDISIRTHLHSKTGCSKCGHESSVDVRTKFKDLSRYVDILHQTHNFKYEYLKYDVSKRRIYYKCLKHGLIDQNINIHLDGHGCKQCGYENFSITKDQFLEKARAIHPEGYEYVFGSKFTVNDKITIKHSCGHIYKGRVSNHLNGQGCSRCKSSSGEKRIAAFLVKQEIDFITQYKILGSNYRYDFYIPELNLLIEYDGMQHFKPVEFFGGDQKYQQRLKNDKAKTLLAKSTGHKLIRIPYTEFNNLETYLSRAIDKYFKYRINRVFYKNFMSVCNQLNYPGTTRVRDLDEYRTYNVLSLLNQ